jgi:UDP-N-acetylmuramoyl-L-alanyl-D-glutamate--2,6-diaminopimelate ligase
MIAKLIREFLHENNVKGVAFHTRDVRDGWLFVALSGVTVDGAKFIPAAVESGAVAVIAERDAECSVPLMVVEDARAALAIAAAEFYGNPADKLRLIGVTGTNGKTSVTYFIDEILRRCGRKTGLIGTVGARVGAEDLDIAIATSTTPDQPQLHEIFARMLQMGVTDVVMEVSSHALALRKMEGLTFDVGVFTNLTQDHLDFHGTMENYAAAKAKLFAQSKYAVVNADSEYTPIMLAEFTGDAHAAYSIDAESGYQATGITYGAGDTTFTLNGAAFSLPVRGRFSVYNALAAIAAAEHLGLEPEKIRDAVADLSGVPGRIQAVPNTRGVHVLVDYAHSPDGLANIIPAVREFTSGRLITLFGCGGDRDREKRPIMGDISGRMSDYTILTSDNPRTEEPAQIIREISQGLTGYSYEIIPDRAEAIRKGVAMLNPGDALIIAGKGHEDYQIIGTEKIHFSDFETATEALQ